MTTPHAFPITISNADRPTLCHWAARPETAPARALRARIVLAVTREQVSPNGTRWSTRQLARRVGLSQSAVYRIWRAFGLQPHRAESCTRALSGRGSSAPAT